MLTDVLWKVAARRGPAPMVAARGAGARVKSCEEGAAVGRLTALASRGRSAAAMLWQPAGESRAAGFGAGAQGGGAAGREDGEGEGRWGGRTTESGMRGPEGQGRRRGPRGGREHEGSEAVRQKRGA